VPHWMSVGPPMPMPMRLNGRGTLYCRQHVVHVLGLAGASERPAPYSAGHVGVA
jgi:hypothetical protein